MNAILLFLTFSGLTIAGLLREDLRKSSLSRTPEEWTADFMGLFIQGLVIPAVPFLLVPLLANFFPYLDQRFDVSAPIQFIIGFVGVDYLYYWNHRLFHGKNWWHIHRLHHSSRHLDVFATSRNSFVTSFLFIYIWAQVSGMLLLKEHMPFMSGLALTFALDLWRHSGLHSPNILRSLLGPFLILPEHHVLHHSVHGRNKNFGANIVWWDKIHGTYSAEFIQNKNLEKLTTRSIWKELFFPEKAGR